MQRLWCVALLSLCTLSCSSPPAEKAAPAAPHVADESRRFPEENRVRIELVPEHLLGKDFLPGGNLADYKGKLGTYQQFLIRTNSPQAASFLLLDFKKALADAKYMPQIGGYFGTDNGRPVYVFSKDKFLAGFVGLSQEEAEPLARRFATYLF